MDTKKKELDAMFGDFTSYKLTNNTTVISLRNNKQFIYLLEGEERSLLIDTGWGCEALKDVVAQLTHKPLLVMNTHFHGDHSGGNYLFDEVMVSENYEADMKAHQAGVFSYLPLYENYTIRGVGDMELDLGNRPLSLIKLQPGHSNSSLFVYDKTNRMLFSGDDIEAQSVIMCDMSRDEKSTFDLQTRLSQYAHNLRKVKDLSIDFILPSHHFTPISKEYLYDYLEMAEKGFSATMEVKPLLSPDKEVAFLSDKLCVVGYKKAHMLVMKDQLASLIQQM